MRKSSGQLHQWVLSMVCRPAVWEYIHAWCMCHEAGVSAHVAIKISFLILNRHSTTDKNRLEIYPMSCWMNLGWVRKAKTNKRHPIFYSGRLGVVSLSYTPVLRTVSSERQHPLINVSLVPSRRDNYRRKRLNKSLTAILIVEILAWSWFSLRNLRPKSRNSFLAHTYIHIQCWRWSEKSKHAMRYPGSRYYEGKKNLSTWAPISSNLSLLLEGDFHRAKPDI